MRDISSQVLRAIAISAVFSGSQAVFANSNTISGFYNGVSWSAKSLLTGVTSTGNAGNPAGDSIYHPSYPAYNGAAYLLMDYGPSVGVFACSGTLLNDRRSILTAAHCVSDGAGTANPLTTTVLFQPELGLSANTRIQTGLVPASGVTSIGVSNYFVHSAYTGDVIDQNDIAILRLSDFAPNWTTSYGLYTGSNLTGKDFTATGYGLLGAGATGTSGFSARLRTGENSYDFRLGDSLFGGGWSSVLGEPLSQIEHSWVSDFDSGLAANDASCRLAKAANLAGASGSVFCDSGLGAREVGVASGDSGGGDFIDGLLASVNSYGLTFGLNWGDVDNNLNSSFGELSGYVPVYLHEDWISRMMFNDVPEPGSSALVIVGLMGLAAVTRRRKISTH